MIPKEVHFIDAGLIPFGKAWDLQKDLFNKTLNASQVEQNQNAGYLIFCEHPHVITLGLHGNAENLLIPKEVLEKKGIELFKIDRGGDITYHGPGQLVVYPVFNLAILKTGVKEYVSKLEEAVIRTLNELGIRAGRLHGASGVWIEPDTRQKARKICAVGVKVSRWISMHGIAFNINTDLEYFKFINPCGFTDKGVTSVSVETGQPADMNSIKKILLRQFAEVFNLISDI